MWKNFSENYEEILEFVEKLTKPILGCNHERTGANLLIEKNGRGYPSYKCRQCTNARRRKLRKERKKNNE